MTVLDEILERKRAEVAELDADALRSRLAEAPPVRDFAGALETGPSPRVIAEFKRRSPSKGPIRPGAEPAKIARAYAASGAAALSVLTDRDFFGGGLDDLRAAREACALPVLRKDFTVDAVQVIEARAAGADAILLIAAALDDATLADLHAVAHELGLAALVEVHSHQELERARAIGARLIGINNRDLHSFKTDVAVTRALLPHVQAGGDATIVSESGLDDPDVLRALEAEGVGAFLVGEALMRAPDPGAALRTLRGAS